MAPIDKETALDLRRVMQWDAWATGVSTLLTIGAAPLLGDRLGELNRDRRLLVRRSYPQTGKGD